MEDRIVEFPNRIKLVPVEGTTDTYDVVEVPGTVTSEGTPLSKATLMSDTIGTRYGLQAENTIVDMFSRNVQEILATIPASGWSTEPDTDGWYTNQVAIEDMKEAYSPLMLLIPTSKEIVGEEQADFALIAICDTYDGYIIAKATDVPENDLNVRFMGV